MGGMYHQGGTNGRYHYDRLKKRGGLGGYHHPKGKVDEEHGTFAETRVCIQTPASSHKYAFRVNMESRWYNPKQSKDKTERKNPSPSTTPAPSSLHILSSCEMRKSTPTK